jgi:hypothetical protein
MLAADVGYRTHKQSVVRSGWRVLHRAFQADLIAEVTKSFRQDHLQDLVEVGALSRTGERRHTRFGVNVERAPAR